MTDLMPPPYTPVRQKEITRDERIGIGRWHKQIGKTNGVKLCDKCKIFTPAQRCRRRNADVAQQSPLQCDGKINNC